MNLDKYTQKAQEAVIQAQIWLEILITRLLNHPIYC